MITSRLVSAVAWLCWAFNAADANLIISRDGFVTSYVACEADYRPEDCDLPDLPLSILHTLPDFERCAPALLPKPVRNNIWSGAESETTRDENKAAYKRIRVFNHILRDVSHNSTWTTILGQNISFPVGVASSGAHRLVHPEGEIGTARGTTGKGTVYTLAMFSTTSLEDVAASTKGLPGHLWMQTYIFKNRLQTEDVVLRAERAGFKAIVVTVDSPVSPDNRCNVRTLFKDLVLPNFFGGKVSWEASDATLEDLAWVCRLTKLPVVAKGVLSAEDAIRAAKAGVSAILVSNHGGRQLDGSPASIDALPAVAAAIKKYYPHVEVYVDGGVRHGMDVVKALLLGARAVFIGRPALWGLAAAGEKGVIKTLEILRKEFHDSMLVAGFSNPQEIAERHTRASETASGTKEIFSVLN